MQFATIRQLSQQPSKYIRLGDKVIITKHGKPVCALVSLKEEDWEDFVLAEHFGLKKEADKILSKKKKTFTASQLKKKFR